MALNPNTLQPILASDIEQQIRTFLTLGIVPYPQLTQFSNALATAISTRVLGHIQANAQTSATFSGTYPVVGGGGGTVTITNQAVNGTVS